MSNFYRWNGGTTQREGLLLRPGQVFDSSKYPALDIEAELETGRVTEADSKDSVTLLSSEEIASHKATLANRKAFDESEAMLESRRKQLERDRELLRSEQEAFELEKKSFNKARPKKRGIPK